MQEVQETSVPSLGREDPLREEMATHSSILAWRRRLSYGAWCMESQRVGYNLGAEPAHTTIFTIYLLFIEYLVCAALSAFCTLTH